MSGSREVCTFTVDEDLFGIDVIEIQEIIRAQRMTRVPLAPLAVAGLLNVRGQLVTAIDLRRQLGLPPRKLGEEPLNIVTRTVDGAVSLLVDAVGEVIEIADAACEPPPPTLREPARSLLRAVVKLNGCLLLYLDPNAVFRAAFARQPETVQSQNL